MTRHDTRRPDPAARRRRRAGGPIARRPLLTALAAAPLAALGAAAGLPRRALAKVPKQAVQYQSEPNGIERCAACIHYQRTDGTCDLVQGQVEPDGWCALYDTQGAEEQQ